MPIITLPRAILSLVSLAILAGALYLLWSWQDGYYVRDPDGVLRHLHGETWRLYAGLGLLAWSFLGRFVVLLFMRPDRDPPSVERTTARTVVAPDGAALHVETMEVADAPTLVLTHGWGLNSTAWSQTKRAFARRFRLVTWDLPGLGRSKAPPDGKFVIDRFAQGLGAVVAAIGDGPVVLVGHSIGGMTTQTFWRACPEEVKRKVVGVVLVDTTYENPLHTMWLSRLWLALRRPVIEPACWLTVALSPLVWLSSWQSYLSGSSQLAMRLTGFGRHATRGQVDLTARLACKGSPGVQAKGNLAMFRWSAEEVLPAVPVPTLVIAGTQDIVTLPQASQTIAGKIPRARLVPLEGGGHMAFMECAEACNQAIAEFVDDVCGPSTVRPTVEMQAV